MLNAVHQPMRFAPYLRPMVWGGRSLARFLGKNLPTAETYGESWEVSDHALHASPLATASMFGDTYDVFPWLIKLLDVQDYLSIQVHPDDAAVKSLRPGEGGKTEAWYVLDAQPTSRIHAGLKPGVGPRQLRQALNDGRLAACLHSFTPKAGDCVFIPAGTVHAVCGGVLLAEIQQTSDATFRLFDWNRRDSQGNARTLHIEEALASIHWDQGPVEPIAADDPRHVLVRCPYFEIERFNTATPISLGGMGRLQALVVTTGHGRFANGEYALAGDAWVFPVAMPGMMFHPVSPLTGLLCTLP
jgi:mannose-6-phosphate isomerase